MQFPLYFSRRCPPAVSPGRCSPHRENRGSALTLEHLEPRVALDGSGLTGQYFHNTDFTGLAAERIEAVDFAWGSGSPVAGMDGNTFSVRWIGQVEAKFSETYTFRTTSDNGVRLWVDGRLLIDEWTSHTLQADTATIALTAGQRYDVRLEYFESTGGAEIRLQWQSASQPLEAIPASQLYAGPAGVWGEYSDAFGGEAVRVDSTIDFDWGLNRPMTQIAVDNFNVRWTGLIRPEHSEEYTFWTRSDEAVRVWVGDELIIDHWAPHAAEAASGTKALEAGKWYDLRVEYLDVRSEAEVELRWSSDSQTGGALEIVPNENLLAAKHTPLTTSNLLGRGQDPFVIRSGSVYLHVHSRGNSVWITGADQLQDVQRDDPDARSVRVWTAPVGTDYSSQIWAPELNYLDGKWYIYVAASDGDNATHRMHVLERDNPNPLGPFTYKGQLAATTDRWAIDGTVLEWQGERYFVWSGWPGFSNGQQNLYIARMSNPWTISGERVLLAQPTNSWERHGMPINEGPQVLIKNGQLHIIYSGSGYWTPQYALGRLTYSGTGSIMSPSSWTKASSPVFQSTAEVVGVGHASFTKSPDGTEDWIVYHAHPSPGGDPNARVIRIQTFTYASNGMPVFGVPLPADSEVAVPSGIPDPSRVVSAGDFDASGFVNTTDLTTFRAQFGLEKFPGRLVDGRDLLAWQRQLGSSSSAAASSSTSSAILSAAVASEPAMYAEIASAAASPLAASILTVDVTASRLETSPKLGLAPRSEADARIIDDAFAAYRKQTYLAPSSSLVHFKRRAASLEQTVWSDDSEVDEDYRIGAEGAWLMSTGAGDSLGASVGGSLAIELASL